MGAVVLIKEKLEDIISVSEDPTSAGVWEGDASNIEFLKSVRQVHTKFFNNPFEDLEYLKGKGVDPEKISSMKQFYNNLINQPMTNLEDAAKFREQFEVKVIPIGIQLIVKNPLMTEGIEEVEITLYQQLQWSTFGSNRQYGGFQTMFDRVSSNIHEGTYTTNIIVIQQELYNPIKAVLTGTTREFLEETVLFNPSVKVEEL